MEAKTFGSFLAALRKAHGMTQKELAERLHISDKTVSRWEREEGTPDLALIPVLAEIFGVSCDELLRGERRTAAPAEPGETSAKGGAGAAATASSKPLLLPQPIYAIHGAGRGRLPGGADL